MANAQIAGRTIEYVAVQVGGNVELFADTAGNHGSRRGRHPHCWWARRWRTSTSGNINH